jgi:hypothetical protein
LKVRLSVVVQVDAVLAASRLGERLARRRHEGDENVFDQLGIVLLLSFISNNKVDDLRVLTEWVERG